MLNNANAVKRKSKRNSRGSTVVEFAVVFLVLFTLIFGIIDFGRAVYAYHFVANAAREATRYASIRGTASCKAPRTFPAEANCPTQNTDVATFVTTKLDSAGIYVNAAASPTDPGYLGVTTTWPGTKGGGAGCLVAGASPPSTVKDPGCVVQVLVQYNFGFTLPLLSQATNIVVKSTSKFVISQ